MSNSNFQSFISPQSNLPEITLKVMLISVGLTLILAVANTYLALKIGMLTSASIPAAIIAMGILRFFRRSNILENNLIQTAASSGEAIAGGYVYAIPAMVIIGYWHGFSYLENFSIGLISGLLGVLFSIPVRNVLMRDQHLSFPEGRAIAEVLIAGTKQTAGLRELALGGMVGALVELMQTGFKIMAASVQLWFTAGRMIYGFGAGFSAAMIGAGYLMGVNIAVSIFIGVLIAYGILVPVLSEIYAFHFINQDPTAVSLSIYNTNLRYIGVGAMLIAGFFILLTLFKPFVAGVIESFKVFSVRHHDLLRTERDIPLIYVLIMIGVLTFALFILFHQVLPLDGLNLQPFAQYAFLILTLVYIILIGFIFSAITGYFSGLVGVTVSPGSSVLIAVLLITACLLKVSFTASSIFDIKLLEAICIMVVAVIMGAAAIANDTSQDLKVGHIIGATPWKQQVMLIIGVALSAAVIPIVMQLLFSVYGIADVTPRPGMDLTQTLPAPPAAVLAAITQGFFSGHVYWSMLALGALIGFISIALNFILKRFGQSISVLGVAIGIYLPISTSMPLCIGGLLAFLTQKAIQRNEKPGIPLEQKRLHYAHQKTILIACGLVSGAAIMDVILAVPFAMYKSPDILKINLPHWQLSGEVIGLFFVIALGVWFYQTAKIHLHSN